MKSTHYELKKKYFEILAKDPDYPVWLDFECKNQRMNAWDRCAEPLLWLSGNDYRYNPLPKKWIPKGGWKLASFLSVSHYLLPEDEQKLQAYATKLSWLREQGGHELKLGGENYHAYKSCDGTIQVEVRKYQPSQDGIYMSEEQAEKWLEMVKNGEV